MQIDLNGKTIVTSARDLADLIDEHGFDPASIVTAMNGAFVPRDLRSRAKLSDGAKIEILSPMQGG